MAAWLATRDVYRQALGRNDVTPGLIAGIQTFGELIHFHPHIHALVTDGAFTPGGGFLSLPPIDKQLLRTAWEDRVFELYVSEGLLDPATVEEMRRWPHSGFSVDNGTDVPARDTAGLTRLAQYMLRCPFSLARIVRVTDDGTVLYRAEPDHCRPFPGPASGDLRRGAKRNFQVFTALDFLAEVTQHIPEKGEHLVRYYGWYSHRRRGMRAGSGSYSVVSGTALAAGGFIPPIPTRSVSEEPVAVRRSTSIWAMLIQRIYEVDPLKCPKCGGTMKIISFIERNQADVIERILKHCGLWEGPIRTPVGPRAPDRPCLIRTSTNWYLTETSWKRKPGRAVVFLPQASGLKP